MDRATFGQPRDQPLRRLLGVLYMASSSGPAWPISGCPCSSRPARIELSSRRLSDRFPATTGQRLSPGAQTTSTWPGEDSSQLNIWTIDHDRNVARHSGGGLSSFAL